jgi:hypothetical protein
LFISCSAVRKYPTIGVCGLDCGLCPRYYTAGTSRCPGCDGPDFMNKHPSCSFITCCVRKKKLEVCAECSDFPCPKFKSEEEYQLLKESSSYPSVRKIMPNLNYIKSNGIEKFAEQQNERIKLLETFISNFNEGRSRSFYCRATCLLDIGSLKESLDKAIQTTRTENISPDNLKSKAKILKDILDETALKAGVQLKQN